MTKGSLPRRGLGSLLLAGSAGAALSAQAASPASTLSINVRDFSARGDGLTDDAPSINAALDSFRDRQFELQKFGGFGCRLEFPTGIYLAKSPLNFTGLRSMNTLIDGQSSVILGQCSGAPVLDALGSRWLTMRDLTIIGDERFIPSFGIQLGCLKPHFVADDHLFSNVKIMGHFSGACLYNRGGEGSVFEHLLLWNHVSTGYCLIQDGANHFDVSSDFDTYDLERGRGLSFNDNLFLNCDFRHETIGVPIWLASTASHKFLRCYAATNGGAAFVVFGNQSMLDIDCHCETYKVDTIFLFDGMRAISDIQGFTFREHECFANVAVFDSAPSIDRVNLYNARIEIATYANKNAMLFKNPKIWAASGAYWSSSTETWNGDSVYSGIVTLGLRTKMIGVAHETPR